MQVHPLLKPQVTALTPDDRYYGEFEIAPLERGMGHTIGNALRRVLLELMPGYAVTNLRIPGILHQFSAVPGVLEDALTITLNLKRLRVKLYGATERTVQIRATKPGPLRAGDLDLPPDVEVLNPDLVLLNVGAAGSFQAEITIRSGRGFVPAERFQSDVIGDIAIDGNFSPIVRVAVLVEKTRVQDNADLDKVILQIETDGSIRPAEALALASKILVDHYITIIDLVPGVADLRLLESPPEEEKVDVEESIPIEELELSVRSYNALTEHAGVRTLKDLMRFTVADLKKVRNLGKKSVAEILAKLAERGIHLKDS